MAAIEMHAYNCDNVGTYENNDYDGSNGELGLSALVHAIRGVHSCTSHLVH